MNVSECAAVYEKELLFEFDSPNRDSLKVYGYKFVPENLNKNKNNNKIVIISGLNGNELNQVYTSGQIVNYLNSKIQEDQQEDRMQQEYFLNSQILIIPSVNHFALNMGERFWPLDKTNIDVMFPGYEQGETTQRIAAKLFEILKNYTHAILLEDRKDISKCNIHIKLFKTGYEDIDNAKNFGFRFINLKEILPIESGSLQYNLQLWNIKSCSIVFGSKQDIDEAESLEVQEGIVRYLSKIDAIKQKIFNGYESEIVEQGAIFKLKATKSGIFKPLIKNSQHVNKNQIIGKIIEPTSGEEKEILRSPANGVVMCQYGYPLIFESSIAFRVIEKN